MPSSVVDRGRRVIEIVVVCVSVWFLMRGWAGHQPELVLGLALMFLCLVLAVLEVALCFNKPYRIVVPRLPDTAQPNGLDAVAMLQAEFEYARITGSEALSDRHTVVNFYLVPTGAVLSAVVALLKSDAPGAGIVSRDLPLCLAALLLWILCMVGVLHLLQIVRLRQAWQDSVKTMNAIKEFYLLHVSTLSPQEFSSAFRWRYLTIPLAERWWTIHFLSAAVISLLGSLLFVLGSALLGLGVDLSAVEWRQVAPGLALSGLFQLFLSMHMYRRFLAPEKHADKSGGRRCA